MDGNALPNSLTRVNQTIHTWLGILLSLWVFLMALTGTILFYKSNLLKWQYPPLDIAEPLGTRTVGALLDSLPSSLSNGYAYLPTEDAPWLEVVDAAKTHWYFTEQGMVLERPLNSDYLSFFVSLHHDLMLGETGKDILGMLGLASLILMVTGIARWWPRHHFSRRLFTIHWFSLRSRKGLQTLGELHKVSAVVLSIPITLVLVTGTAIIYSSQVNSALVTLLPQRGKQPEIAEMTIQASTWQTRLDLANNIFESASPRLIYLSTNRVRLKHDSEWHPNGRNYITFSPSGKVTEVEDVRQTARGNQISHTIYPLHVAVIGGTPYLLLATMAGLTLLLLPITGLWFWIKRHQYRKK